MDANSVNSPETVSQVTRVVFIIYAQAPWVIMLFALVIIDVLAGTLLAAGNGKISSKLSVKGMTRKALYFVLVAACAVLDRLQADIPTAKIASGFLCYAEIISILETMKRAGIYLPQWLDKAIAKKHDDDDKGPTTGGGGIPPVDVHLTLSNIQADAHVKQSDPQSKA